MEIMGSKRHGSLFSGIGGFDLAAEWMGWENVFHCEWNSFGQKVLKHYWPNAISYEDITKTDFTIHRGTIDILTGGFPCQPYSMAGKRLGKEDERHLWPEMLRAIREIQPTWVVGENVFGLVNWSGGLVFHEVQADLEAQGYEVQPYVLPACAVNAPHRRDRVWFVAKNTRSDGRIFRQSVEEGAEVREQRDIGAGDTERVRAEEMAGINSNANSNGLNERNGNNEVNTSQGGLNALCESNGNGDAADTERSRWQQSNEEMERGSSEQSDCSCIQQHAFNTYCIRCKRGLSTNIFVQFPNKESSPKVNLLPNGKRRGKLQFENFPTKSPICDGDDGISDRLDSITFPKWRTESIKAGGNAVVPQVVYQIFKAIEQYDPPPLSGTLHQ